MTRNLAIFLVAGIALALSACSGMNSGTNMNPHPPTGQNHAKQQHYPQGQ